MLRLVQLSLLLLLLVDRRDGRSVAGDDDRCGGHSGDGYNRQDGSFDLQRLRVGDAGVAVAALLLLLLLQLVRDDHLGCAFLGDALTLLVLVLLLLLLLLLLMVQHRVGRGDVDHRDAARLVRLTGLLLEHELLQDVTLAGLAAGGGLDQLAGGLILLVGLLDELLLQLLDRLLLLLVHGLGVLLVLLLLLLLLLMLLERVLLLELLNGGLLLKQRLLLLNLLLLLLLLGLLLLLSVLDLLLKLQLLLLVGSQHRLDVQHGR